MSTPPGSEELPQGPRSTEPPPSSAPPTPTRRVLLAALAASLVVVVTLVVVVVQRQPVPLDPATPAGTVQAWLQSVADGTPRDDLVDLDGCDPLDVELDGRIRVVVTDTRIDGDRARVDLSVSEDLGGFGSAWQHDETYQLRRRGSGWVVADFAWPWNRCDDEAGE